MLQGKNIVLGVTGGIAVYKSVEIVSRLRKAGAQVKVIMTEAASKFVAPLTFREISQNPVAVSMWSEVSNWNVEHIALASWADLFLIAPATANFIGKVANGIADDMLTTTVMATRAKVIVAPAMNTNMFENPVVKENLQKLAQLGYEIIPPAIGKLACGTEGCGRLPEPVDIVGVLTRLQTQQQSLQGKKVVVTAGGTQEPIDPVRYVGNNSSGKMGYALAKRAQLRGADVVLVSGPTFLPDPPGIKVVRVKTALQMREAVLNEYSDADIVIKAAAVADYRPQSRAEQKIKKTEENLTIVLEKNPDILLELGQRKTKQFLVGFAAETQELLANAREKLHKKNLDMIVANDVTLAGAGFNADTNIIKILLTDGSVIELPQLSKEEVADEIFNRIDSLLSIRP